MKRQSEVQGHSQLQNEFEARLPYINPVPRNRQTRNKKYLEKKNQANKTKQQQNSLKPGTQEPAKSPT